MTTDYLIGIRVESDDEAPHLDDVIEAIGTARPTVDGFEIVAMRIDGRRVGDPEGFDWYEATR